MANVPRAELLTICRGAALELFQSALAQINQNIKDPNTSPSKKRSINIKFEFSPYKDRSGAEVLIGVETKLSSHQGVNGTIFLCKTQTGFEAFTQDISQLEMFDPEAEAEPAADTKAAGRTQ